TADIIDIAPDPRNSAVGSVSILFSEPVSGVDLADFSLTRNGTPVSLSGLTLSGSGSSYTLNLSTVTSSEGTYVLTLVAASSGISDAVGNLLSTSASDSWLTDITLPTADILGIRPPTADILDINPDSRNTAVGNVNITFSAPVTGV